MLSVFHYPKYKFSLIIQVKFKPHHTDSKIIPIGQTNITKTHLGCAIAISHRTGSICEKHGGKSKGTTCVVGRDFTAYMVVDRVLRFPTE